MDWFAYPSNVKTASDPSSLEMVMVLADKKALGIDTSFRPSFNFNQSLQKFSSAIEEGTLLLQVDGYNVWVKSLVSCSDKSCNDTQTLADSDKPPVWTVPTVKRKPAKRNDGVSISPRNAGMYGVTAFVIMLMNKHSF